MTISYAQNQEDIWLNRVFADKTEGFYIDVGAHMPETDSVTKLFYDRGWRGINLEPIPELYALFLKERPRDINLQIAAGAEKGTLNLHTPPAGQQGVATLDPYTAELVRAAQIDNSTLLPVQVSTLADICWEHAPETIDFLKIDVEGFEKNVILGMDFKEFRPTVLVVEAVQPWKHIQDPVSQAAYGTWHDWEPLLMDAGYVFATFDGLSRYYVRKEDQHLVAKFIIPVSPFVDGYAKPSEIFWATAPPQMLESKTLCEVFNTIYTRNAWGRGSGAGSHPEVTKEYRDFLQKFIALHNIKTIVDAGCGDWQFTRLLDFSNVQYTGYDVAKYVIDANTKEYASDTVNFVQYDGNFNALNSADLLVCKDVLQHLPNENVHNFVSNLPRFKYALVTNDIPIPPDRSENIEITPGDWRPLDLRLDPFCINAEEVLVIKKGELDGTNYKSVLLYSAINNCKELSRQAARFHYTYRVENTPTAPQKNMLTSKVSTQADIDSPWCAYWTSVLKMERIYHRKIWEQAFVPQALYNTGMLQKGKRGIVFGCGREPLPSLFASLGCAITATDAPSDIGWVGSTMYADSLENLYYPSLVDKETFSQHVTLEYVDMNALPQKLDGEYDFCWSICAFEHLGSLQAGMDFVKNSLRVLKKGGTAVHTTEFNYANDQETIATGNSVLYQKKHFAQLVRELQKEGHRITEPDYTIGEDIFDRYVDQPPYSADGYEGGGPHLKLNISGYASTCFGIIITKK